ncbi:sugar ABC transporter ATP-binding protein [Paracoccus denitrificans]|jgi:ribose transport system ATP-binding protein|uniref:Monosaccharide ABC transporter ATP-binding protein, CUT2 family n=1 Tax=Paracoccus denitrificans (strain Pd 1222) TaxID=318586 RepID=A1BBD6_PARDP|nr:sugar ABC transporter ATP-binding protein [Paracoccus denitrificans]ABL72830.1 monosaccharide ABC transporter ATP-binding protein, CUT2 family [Paracoccus denitrificans PD1222]MBB4626309.1 ribose transport system ATP-binding protein [Paracoccus denitrificans]MCU7427486.1 sugar ABC transporter ATP-binding protein [Paracoccus denitrificans]QAR29241.1 sugar ABC transporter ATP-binding protein [Paracoccus denitrificans]UPV98431.1 sugar ABC transporter ATP-binding protein [Paracoccus denitrifica
MTVLALDNVSKSFGPIEVLHGVDLALEPGEVHALIGENGAGKSTIMKILGGFLDPTSGQILLDGEPVHFASGPEAEAQGIVVIHQEFNLASDLTVAANVFLGREIGGWRLDHAAMRDATAALLKRLDTRIDPDARIRDLSVPDRQMVEIAKALSRKARVLIMDEPSAVLTHREVGALYAQIDRLRAEGVAILYCSHRLDEVAYLADRITVLRDGRVVRQALRGELTEDGMATAMVGRELQDFYPPKGQPGDQPALEVRGLTVPSRVRDVSFTLRRGEVLGIAGLVGSGRTELAEGLVGLRPSTGNIRVEGREVAIRSLRDAFAAGLAYLTEDRKEAGLLLDKGLRENLTLATLERFGGWRLDTRAEDAALERATREFDIRAPRRDMPAGKLSGGNQQKLLLAKVMLPDPGIILIDEPTRGIDVGTKRQIYAFIRKLAAEGRSLIVISSEMTEVIGLADRVLVMREGRLAGELAGADMTEDSIVRLAMGVTGEAA